MTPERWFVAVGSAWFAVGCAAKAPLDEPGPASATDGASGSESANGGNGSVNPVAPGQPSLVMPGGGAQGGVVAPPVPNVPGNPAGGAGSTPPSTIPVGSGGADTVLPTPPVSTEDIITDLPSDGGSGPGATSGSDGRDPRTCEEAAQFRTYLGCEYYPTVLGNVANSEFDFAVIVANIGVESADVQVTGPAGFSTTATVAARQLATIYLPWVPELKGPDLEASACTAETLAGSVSAPGSAYHLVSTLPVAAYQFNPLQYFPTGGPPGKVWSCDSSGEPRCACNSYGNDASLLLPVNALTSNYVVVTWRDEGTPTRSKPGYISITATADATEVAVQVGPNGAIAPGVAGSGIDGAMAGELFALTLNQGDVVELVAVAGTDLTGTQIQSTDGKPVQVMTGSPSARVPDDTVESGDHIEELMAPAEALGTNYVVTVPSGPYGDPVAHVVRIYAHATATLTYYPSVPLGAPASLAAGEFVDFQTSQDFQVLGSGPFAVASFLVGGEILDPNLEDPTAPKAVSSGDPSQSIVAAVPQFRDRYVFLAPIDYETNHADIVAPAGATVTLDGNVLDPATATTTSGRADDGTTPQDFQIYRVELDIGPGFMGAHELLGSVPIGLQVVGYGRYTSYQYPGGLNLNLISDPPPNIIAQAR